MTLADVIAGLPEVEDRPDVHTLRVWEGSPAWAFVSRHAPKIRKKMRTATTLDDRLDLAAELGWGLMLSQEANSRVTYEAHAAERGRGPDFSVILRGLAFNAEVKRIRVTSLESRLELWLERMRLRFLTLQPRQRLLVGFQLLDLHDRDHEDWLAELEAREAEIATCADEAILQSQLGVGESDSVVVGEGVTLLLSDCPGEPRVGNAGSTYPIMYTQREYMKLGSLLMVSMGQMRPGEVNVLAVDTHNSTHEGMDLDDALQELRGCDDSVFTDNGFSGRDDFWNQARVLSGVVFRSAWRSAMGGPRNHVWANPTATSPFPRSLQDYLADLDGVPG